MQLKFARKKYFFTLEFIEAYDMFHSFLNNSNIFEDDISKSKYGLHFADYFISFKQKCILKYLLSVSLNKASSCFNTPKTMVIKLTIKCIFFLF